MYIKKYTFGNTVFNYVLDIIMRFTFTFYQIVFLHLNYVKHVYTCITLIL
jgi:hypothetical protein